MRIALSLAAFAFVAATLAPTPAVQAASCKTLSYGYVGYTRSGTEGFVRRQLAKKIASWKEDRSLPNARVGATDIACKKFLQVGFFVEWECNAKANVCG
ncbi:MAG: hypothetical protein ACR2PO_17925 [Methyloligellaceae bacterium]